MFCPGCTLAGFATVVHSQAFACFHVGVHQLPLAHGACGKLRCQVDFISDHEADHASSSRVVIVAALDPFDMRFGRFESLWTWIRSASSEPKLMSLAMQSHDIFVSKEQAWPPEDRG